MNEAWDVVVIGAGPAGSMAARSAAKDGTRVLLVDRATFPRGKVCGCCVNAAALATLDRAGLGPMATRCGAVPVDELLLASGGRAVTLQLPNGVALSRRALDAALIDAAQAAGVTFRDRTSASVRGCDDENRVVCLNDHATVAAAVVIVADGLGGRALNDEPWFAPVIDTTGRIGAATIVNAAPDFYRSGRIHMACGRAGYVGLVRLEDGQLNVAAAFDAPWIKQTLNIGKAATSILADAGFPAIAGLDKAAWRGTPRLTRRRRVAGERLLVVGDAAGYVEPFTGEGIAWALACGVAAGRLAARPWDCRMIRAWTDEHRRIVSRRQRMCRAVTLALRWPWLTRLMVRGLSVRPGLAWPVMRGINAARG